MQIKRKLKYLLPVHFKKILKYCFYLLQDIINFFKKDSLKGYPPKRLNFVGSSEFKKVGDEFFEYFVKYGKLKPDDIVLDVGCGIGRMAIPLTKYVNNRGGGYYGFDIDKRGIKWCQKNISSKFPYFHFNFVDIFNKYYNKRGKIKAHKFIFPYENNKFDFVIATSVFTHMLPDQITQYLAEINRVLKPSGKCFLTWFSIDSEAENNIKNNISNCDFKYEFENYCFYSHKNVPEAEVGYKEHWIIDQLKKVDCYKNLKIYHGNWSKRKSGLSYQDIFISEKGRCDFFVASKQTLS